MRKQGQCAVAIFDSLPQAREALDALEQADVPPEQVSLVAAAEQNEIDGKSLNLGDDSMRDAAIGAGVGSAAGVLGGVAIYTVAGVGSLLIAGPLGMGLAGFTVGAIVGAMQGWGVHDQRLKDYQELVEKGSVLVVVHGDTLQLVEAQRVLEGTQATEVEHHARSTDATEEVDDRDSL